MEKFSLSEIRKELSFAGAEELRIICLRMARFKKDNKDHLAFLLFQKEEPEFIQSVKEEVTEALADIQRMHVYQARKVLQKTLSMLIKYKKFCLSRVFEIEVMLHFIKTMQSKQISEYTPSYIGQFYKKQQLKLVKILESLDEELFMDYKQEVEDLL